MLRQFKKWFQDKIGIGENRDRLDFLEKKIRFNGILIQELMPALLDFDPAGKGIESMKTEKSPVASVIHKNDIMFISNLFHNEDVDQSLKVYFSLGDNTARQIHEIAVSGNASILEKGGNLLDFGAGYGRVSRFFPRYFGEKVSYYASEIKEEAMRFHEEQLGYRGIVHGPHADSFKSDRKFDLIFVGSVFTHLPQRMTEEWLSKLADHLSESGFLIFTTHNIRTYNISQTKDFHFDPGSEDSSFDAVEDSLENQSEYGTSYVSDELIRKWMDDRGLGFEIQPRAFGGTQDLIISQRKV